MPRGGLCGGRWQGLGVLDVRIALGREWPPVASYCGPANVLRNAKVPVAC
jgi:hypothetical protein